MRRVALTSLASLHRGLASPLAPMSRGLATATSAPAKRISKRRGFSKKSMNVEVIKLMIYLLAPIGASYVYSNPPILKYIVEKTSYVVYPPERDTSGAGNAIRNLRQMEMIRTKLEDEDRRKSNEISSK